MRTQTWWAAALTATVLTAGLHAQSTSGASQPSSGPAAREVTVTGCVERADQVVSRELLGTSLDSLSFVLIRARDAAAANTGAVGTTGVAGDRSSDAIGNTYRLSGELDALNPHVGQQVEIVGRVEPPAAATAAPGAPQTAAGATGAPQTAAGTPAPAVSPVLVVKSVKQIASSCPG